ncbi:nuclease-related domain-containing protein [Peribacillus deserti]|uniref:Nuclease n=1 Tax=Peribacillus deserti TaxID=673318 RepID=A0A2N5M5C9_9BACI|nr:nuclease-related domain-containing protein [Peribacillus deserti]PLT29566.1 nuclease [Peribacillus deserti]
MLLKSRTESTELLILKSLHTRLNMPEKYKQQYFSLKKGYEGELLFDSLTEKLDCECIILSDLLLKINNTMFQIDSLIIKSESIYLFEVKNFEGDYYYESDRFYMKPNVEINNPLNQLNRSESLLRQLLHNLGFNIPITASVVFINPEFTLYQTPLNKPFIFPTQVNRYFKKLNAISNKLDGKFKILAEQLISLHTKESPFKHLPAYEYAHLQKGIACVECSSFSITVEGQKCICKKCGQAETVVSSVMRSVDEFILLFPEQKITTNIIHDWCNIIQSKKRIREILKKKLKIAGVHQWSFYE